MAFQITSGENALLEFALIDLPDGLTWKGTWSSTTAYGVDDAVFDTDVAYKCISANTNHEPPNATYWSVLDTPIAANDIQSILVEFIQDAKVAVNVSYQIVGAVLTSGSLVAGSRYRIARFVSGDNFINVGARSNATGVIFTATGTTPTDWSHHSGLQQINAPTNLSLSDGVVEIELLALNTLSLAGDFEVRITVAKLDRLYIGSGSNSTVRCLPNAITVTPC